MHRFQTKQPDEMTLLVLERGAPWPTWGAQLRERASHSAVELQAEGESLSEFHGRIRSRVQRLNQSGIVLAAAAYVCAYEGSDVHDSRLDCCEALLETLAEDTRAEMTIGGDAWDADSPARLNVIQLWSELSSLRRKVSIALRFEEHEDISGVYTTRPTPSGRPAADSSTYAGLSKPGVKRVETAVGYAKVADSMS